MNHKEMMHSVKQDLGHIPKWTKGSAQNRFRAAYEMTRLNHLRRTPPPPRIETIKEATATIRTADPGFEPQHESEYFAD
jgi:hypothetical protein